MSVDQKTRLSICFKTCGQAFEMLSQAFETLGQVFEGLREKQKPGQVFEKLGQVFVITRRMLSQSATIIFSACGIFSCYTV